MTASDRIAPTPEQLDAAAVTFDLLSVPARLHLVWLLSEGTHDVSTLAGLTGAAIPATSQQLAKLRASGIVTARREGRRQLYRVANPQIADVVRLMFQHIAPDGTIAIPYDARRPPRRPRIGAVEIG